MSLKKGDIMYADVTKPAIPPYTNTGYCTRYVVDSNEQNAKVSVCAYIGPKVDGVQDCTATPNTLCYKYGLDPVRESNVPLLCNMLMPTGNLSQFDKCNLCPEAPGPMQ